MFRSTVVILSLTSPYLVRSFAVPPKTRSFCRHGLVRLWTHETSRLFHRNASCLPPETQESDNLQRLVTNAITVQPKHVVNVLHATIRLFQFYNAPEPLQSACHIVAFALQDNNDMHEKPIRWEDNLFSHLLQHVEPIYSLTDVTLHSDLTSFLESIPNLPSIPHIFHRQLTSDQVTHVISMILRRIQKEPLQYIFQQWDFYDFTIKVRRPCLCPRPETEELVDLVSHDIKSMIRIVSSSKTCTRKLRVLDVGAGTGAIGIALARRFPNDIQVVAIDIKEDAVQLSLENAQCLLPKADTLFPLYQVILCSVAQYTNVLQTSSTISSSPHYFCFDVIVSNPPYIPLADMTSLTDDVIKYEDIDALCGGVDGMDVIRNIIQRLEEWCQLNPKDVVVDRTNDDKTPIEPICWMEVDTSQPPLIHRMISSSPYTNIQRMETRTDSQGNNRFVKLAIHRQ